MIDMNHAGEERAGDRLEISGSEIGAVCKDGAGQPRRRTLPGRVSDAIAKLRLLVTMPVGGRLAAYPLNALTGIALMATPPSRHPAVC